MPLIHKTKNGKMVAKGIKQDEIRFIHDAKTDLQKSQLFNDMNTGHKT